MNLLWDQTHSSSFLLQQIHWVNLLENAYIRKIRHLFGYDWSVRIEDITIAVTIFLFSTFFYFFIKNRREYSHLKEREGRSTVSRWEMNRLRTRNSLLAISIVRLFESNLQ